MRSVDYTFAQMKHTSYRHSVTRNRLVLAAALFLCVAFAARATAQSGAKDLLIYAIDVEGGQATLLVAPGGHSLLVDTGWPGNDGRDAERIQAAMKDAGITKIDKVL